MNRRSASLPKSPLNTRSFLRRALTRGPATLALPLLVLNQSAWAANTEYDVKNGSTDLTAPATYTTGGTAGTGANPAATGPTVTSDVTFDSGVAYSPAAFTLGTSQTFGSLNDLSTTAITISNTGGTAASTLTLGGSGDLGDGVPGSNAADLLFVGTGATLNITGGTGNAALGLMLGQSGNFDIAGTSTISSAITGAFNFTKTGAGLLTLSGAIGNGGTITNAGTGTTGNLVSTANTVPGASLYISGAIGSGVTGIVQNSATSDLLLGGNNSAYNNGITIQSGTLLINDVANALGASTNVVTLGNSAANATLQFGARLGNVAGANGSFANPINVSGTGANVISATDYGLTLSGAITLKGNGTTAITNLTLATLNSSGSAITISGGVTGTGNIVVSDDFTSTGNNVSFTTNPVNNVGTITFNNAAVNGGTAGTAAGLNTITGGVGANVTAITQTGNSNSLTISTGALNVNAGGTTLTDSTTNGGVFTVSSAITGTGSLTLNGASATSAVSIYLGGTNTYNGATAINSGNVEFANVNAMPATTAVTVASGGTLTIGVGAASPFFTNGTSGNGTIGGLLSGLGGQSGSTVTFNSGAAVGIDTTSASVIYAANITNGNGGANVLGLTKVGTNTLTLSGTNTYTGPTSIAGGTLQLGNGGTTGSLSTSSAITDNGNLTINRSNAVAQGTDFSGTAIAGTGSLTQAGTGTTTLTAANTFTGATTVSAGTLDLANALALKNSTLTPTTGSVVFDAAVASNAFTVGSLGGSGNLALQNSTGTAAIALTLDAGTATYSGILSGAGSSLTVAGASQTLSGANTYTGTTTISSGTLTLSGSLNGTTGTALSLGGGTLAYTAAASTQNFTGTAIVTGQNAITTVAGSTLNLGAITHTAGATVDFGTTGTINTATANTATSILGGYATVGGNTWAVSAGSAGTPGAITGLAAGSYTPSVAATTTPGTTADVDFQLSNTTAYGSQTINSLRFNTNVATANNTLKIGTGNTLVIASGGILTTSAINPAGNAPAITGGTITSGTGELDVIANNAGNGAAFGISSVIADNGTPLTLVKSGATTLNVTGVNTYTGSTYINNGTLSVGNTGIIGAATSGVYPTVYLGSPNSGNGVTLNNDGTTVPNPINVASGSGTRQLLKTGNNGTAIFSGLITLNAGGGTAGLQVQDNNITTFINITGGIGGTGNVSVVPSSAGRTSGGTTFSTGALNMVGTFTNSASTGQTTTVNSVIGTNVTGVIENNANGNLVLAGTNTFFGDTTLTSGVIRLTNSAALQNSVVNTNSTVGALTFGSGSTNITTAQIGGLNGTGNATIGGAGDIVLVNSGTAAGALALSIGNSNVANGSTTNPNTLSPSYAGIISGAGSITKTGSNTQTFTGANTYTGTTTVSSGTLALANPTGQALSGTSAIAITTGGNLLLGAPNQINTATPIALGTSTFGTPPSTTGMLSVAAGASQGSAATVTGGMVTGNVTTGGTITGTTTAGLGVLTVGSASTLNFGGRPATLVFSGLSIAPDANGNDSILTINGYSNTTALIAGSSGAGIDDRLVVQGDQASYLQDFNFGAGPGVGVSEVALDNGYFEVVGETVPEPSTLVASVFLMGAMAWRFRRRRA